MSFPPYQLLDSEYVAAAQEKYDRLARLYHVGQTQAWDGKRVLGELLDKHGGIRLDESKREAIGHIFSVILWGELAAWSISADLALMLVDTEAKMAATSQAFDEARHFYVLRDYLMAMGRPIPPLDGYTRVILEDLLETHRLGDKLLGMQLIVENIALTLFRVVARTGIEPVLCDLMPYYERDEARHVGLGVMYLPHVLRAAGAVETARLQLLQLKILTLVGWGTHAKQPYFEAIGIDANSSFKHAIKLQQETFQGMRARAPGERPPRAILAGSKFMEDLNLAAIDMFFPTREKLLPKWQQSMIGFCKRLSEVGDRVLRIAA